MRNLGFVTREDNVTMNRKKFRNSPHTPFEIHQINSTGIRYSPTSSILKTPTAIFVTTRNSTAKTKKLKFANGPVDLQTLKNGTRDSNVSLDSGIETSEDRKSHNNGVIISEDSLVEVAISPVKTMQVSPESWKAFLEYKKYNDYANETEKTDYTYSRLSKYRHKEIIPGYMIRPNLSRSSISSRRSSLSLPGSQSSISDSYHSGSYEFKVYNQPQRSELLYEFKTPNQSNKSTRSKYYLRSSSFDGRETGETESVQSDLKSNYIENEYYSHSAPEKLTRTTTTYSTSEVPQSTPYYYGKVRSMNLDDADIDEVDDTLVEHEKHYYGVGDGYYDRDVGGRTGHRFSEHRERPQTVSQYIGNIFTTMFLYVTSVGTFTRDLFSKYILRREDGWSQPSSSSSGYWRKDSSGYATASGSWVPWGKEKAYSSTRYYSDGYYGQPRSWYQRIFYYFYDRFSSLTNFLVGGTSAGYASSRYHETSGRRKFWWLLVPLLLLAGSFLGYIDFFSNPKAILDTMYNWVLFVPSFLYYTVMVFIPRLLFETIPYVALTVIPNFVTVTVPHFLTVTIPYYFWVVVHFFGSLTVAKVAGLLSGAFNFIIYLVTVTWAFIYNFLLQFASLGFWLFRAEQDNGFLSYRYKALDCSTNGLLTSIENTTKLLWRSCYIAYKRAAASASCYVNDSWERLKLPFIHVNEWLCSKIPPLGFVYSVWETLYHGLWNVLGLTRDAFSNLCLFLLGLFTDFLSGLHYIFGCLTDGVFIIANGLARIFGDSWRLLFAPRTEVKHQFVTPDVPKETCSFQQKSIEKLTNDMEGFKSLTWDLSAIKKKIDDLELEFRKEKESRRTQNEFYDKQLDENHKTLQKYQATVNHALLSSKRPSQLSSSSIQYLLDNQSDFLKQWITQNFLLKSDSQEIDENKIGILIAKYSNKTGEELVALKQEFGKFVQNHRSELESLRNNYNTLGANSLGGGDVSVAFIKKLIADAIKLYDADKTGRVDYALETAGGQVVSVRCTETYIASPKSYVLLGWPVFTMTSSPRDAISPGMAAGQCWAFVGALGFLVIQLSHTIEVTGFTMEHISKSLVPRGHIESAPQNFSVWGLKSEHDPEPYLFGEYTYLDNEETLQYFPVVYPTTNQYNMVELKITSNHGNPDYTCLYRIRVHGDLRPRSSMPALNKNL